MVTRLRIWLIFDHNRLRLRRRETLLGWLLCPHHRVNMGRIRTHQSSRPSKSRRRAISDHDSFGPAVHRIQCRTGHGLAIYNGHERAHKPRPYGMAPIRSRDELL